MMGYRELMRRKLLEDIYDRMSDEEKRTFVQLTIQNRDHEEIMRSLDELKRKADSNRNSFLSDFGANVAGNAVWDALLFISYKIFSRV